MDHCFLLSTHFHRLVEDLFPSTGYHTVSHIWKSISIVNLEVFSLASDDHLLSAQTCTFKGLYDQPT